MAEDLTTYMADRGIRVEYLHSDVDTLRRVELLRELRQGTYDVLVGINLLREGLDLPEVSLVAILDADKEGFLRSTTSLIQTIGRAARNVSGEVHMYADKIPPAMKQAIDETQRRRTKQIAYNKKHGINPQPLRKKIADVTDMLAREDIDTQDLLATGYRNHHRPNQPHRRTHPTNAHRRHQPPIRTRRPPTRRTKRPQKRTPHHKPSQLNPPPNTTHHKPKPTKVTQTTNKPHRNPPPKPTRARGIVNSDHKGSTSTNNDVVITVCSRQTRRRGPS